MLKRGLSLAIIMVMVSTLGFASFGDAVKKTVSDEELAEGIKIEQPAIKTVKSDNLTISGTVTTPQGINVTMSLMRLDGKKVIDSADSLMFPSVPKQLLEKDYDGDKEKAVVKKFAKAYEARVQAGIEYEKAYDAFEKARKDAKVSAAKVKELKEEAEKAWRSLAGTLEAYDEASADFSRLSTVTVFSDVTIGGKLPGFSKTEKDVEPGYYSLIFRRSDNDRVIKRLEFEVQSSGDLIRNLEIPSVIPTGDGSKK